MRIGRQVWDELVAHLKRELPGEGVGALLGRGQAVRYHPLQNIAMDQTHFAVSPTEWVSLLHELETTQERLVAIVHSHPSAPPVPSQEDREQFLYPESNLLIVSLQQPDKPVAALYRKIGNRLERQEFFTI
ncbi:Mov34/MPN/PAD-1 family protein [Effusibacillus dendaii]|uniref:MPN domain-containing protein n=1 Tax=Effusibacillus dendaii TaxID=2743772 RepID=A0A7I8D7D2_9BACL|nr:M67 family metallopeptidase [Effusibacillus dendaii]BCJ86004.1 hypothetical protein skT53_09890 [Effusibacillus dendaii]